MAALIIGAIAIGSHKIKQKRDARKQQRAIDEWDAQHVTLRSGQGQAHEAGRPRRKSEEAGERWSVEGEAPPPAYDEAVAQARRAAAARTD